MPWLNNQLITNEDGKFVVLTNSAIGQHLMRGERWEPQLTAIFKAILKSGDFVADVGAYMGYTTTVLANIVGPEGAVVSFEPQRIVFQQLCGNVFLNGLTNVYPHHFALGEVDNVITCLTTVDYFAPWVNISDTSVGGDQGEWVMMRTLDSFGLKKLALIKIDVQGFELAVLRGAKETIAKHRPLLYVEIEDRQLDKYKIDPMALFSLILDMKYTIVHLKNDIPVDFICFPKEGQDLSQLIKDSAGCDIQIIS